MSADKQISSEIGGDSSDSSHPRGRKRNYIESLFRDEGERLEKMARRTIEEAMTRAVVRKCWKCKKRFVKVGGCNSTTCVCGARTCFACRGPITDGLLNGLNHLWCQHKSLDDAKEAGKAAENAKAFLREKYPKLTFKYDPTS